MKPNSQVASVESPFAKDRPLNILVAEDDYTSRRLLVLMLQNMGYQPVVTENGQECLNKVLEGSFDLLLTDLDMPVMSGIECAGHIRAHGLDLVIVAVTASMPELNTERCLEAGMDAFLTKPIRSKDLKRIIREVCIRKWVDECDLVCPTQLDRAFALKADSKKEAV